MQCGSVGAYGECMRAGRGRVREGRGLHQRGQGPATQVHRDVRHRAPDHYVNQSYPCHQKIGTYL